MFSVIQSSKFNHSLFKYCFLSGFLSILLLSCASSQLLSKKEKKNLQTQILESPIFSKNHTGFALYDPIRKEMLLEQDADILFTPASNTKIYTLYTSLKILGDTIPALKYIQQGDSLIFWGTGDPALWHPDLPDNNAVEQLLSDTSFQLFYCPNNFMDERYGAGWAWDDYQYSYQVEKSALPVYGNSIQVQKKEGTTMTWVTPSYFAYLLDANPNDLRTSPRFKRNRYQNSLQLLGRFDKEKAFNQIIPFVYSDQILMGVLQEKIKRPVELLYNISVPTEEKQILYSIPSDTVYQRMMQESDNFLAEQLLLLCANKVFDTLNTRKIIRYAQKNLLADLPDPMRWVDGSGLSRYNLFTPRSTVRLLEKLYQEYPLERILNIFPAGGKSGTISQHYNYLEKPYVYAKTGTLSNRHCLSGYLFTKSGKLLIFSFMHNNYYGSSQPLKEEMDEVLRGLHEAH